jgi:thiol-disulfide isomerase/thioredoxin
VVVLNFFATWCGPCRVEMPELNLLAAQHADGPFVLLGIDAEESPDTVAAFVEEVPVEFPVAIDASGDLLKQFGVEALPTTVLVGADGRITLYQSGAISNSEVAFAGILGANLEIVRSGRGVSRSAYLDAVAEETYPRRGDEASDDGLSLRAASIAEKMDCPCGCTHKVAECGCRTAKRVTARLASMSLEGRSDADVIRELNREFCMEKME